jgi:predicted MFS family arabinose efflux permease
VIRPLQALVPARLGADFRWLLASSWATNLGDGIALVAGSAIGGVIAQRFGVTGPFWFAFVGSAVFVVLIWRQLAFIAHADESPGRRSSHRHARSTKP